MRVFCTTLAIALVCACATWYSASTAQPGGHLVELALLGDHDGAPADISRSPHRGSAGH